MWLLDANMDIHLVTVLSGFGIACDTAANRGWKALSNGQLVAAAVASGFTCLVTRDRLFGESAGQALKQYPDFAVVLVHLPQRRWEQYQQDYLRAWSLAPILPEPGGVIEWPAFPRRPD